MRLNKLDPSLQAALSGQASASDREVTHLVFVSTASDLADAAGRLLQTLDARSAGRDVYTAELTRSEIDSLTEQEWILQMRLSHRLRPSRS